MRAFFVFGLLLCIAFTQAYKLEKRHGGRHCKVRRADVTIVLDSSTSIDPKDYEKDIGFLDKLVEDMVIADDGVNVGLIQYSTKAHFRWGLKDHVEKNKLKAAIKGTKQIFGNTNTGEALKMMREKMMPGRDKVPNVGIVITDGNSQEGQKTKDEAKRTRDAGAILIAVGVGPDVSPEELNNIATSPEYVINVDSYSDLEGNDGIFGKIMGRLCEAAPAPGPDCAGQKADIGIILDSSTSISEEDFKKDVAFLAELATTFAISADQVHMGLIQYATNAHWNWGLTDHLTKDELKGSFLAVKQLFGDTNTGAALNMARTDMFPASKGGRPGQVPQVAIVITDGNSQRPQHTKENADKIKSEKVMVIAVGVGSSVSMDELRNIATSPNHIIQVENYGALIAGLEKIVGKVCE